MIVYWVDSGYGLEDSKVKKANVWKETAQYLYLDRPGLGWLGRYHRSVINIKIFRTPYDAMKAYVKSRELDVSKAKDTLTDRIDELNRAKKWVKEQNKARTDKGDNDMKCPICGSMRYHIENNCAHCDECGYWLCYDIGKGEDWSGSRQREEVIDNE